MPAHFSHCEESDREIRERARILSHKGVASAAKLGKPSAGDGVNECQGIRGWDDYVLGAGRDKRGHVQVPKPVAEIIAMPGVHCDSLPMN